MLMCSLTRENKEKRLVLWFPKNWLVSDGDCGALGGKGDLGKGQSKGVHLLFFIKYDLFCNCGLK